MLTSGVDNTTARCPFERTDSVYNRVGDAVECTVVRVEDKHVSKQAGELNPMVERKDVDMSSAHSSAKNAEWTT